MLKHRLEYPVDLKEFEDLPRRQIWRLKYLGILRCTSSLEKRYKYEDWQYKENKLV